MVRGKRVVEIWILVFSSDIIAKNFRNVLSNKLSTYSEIVDGKIWLIFGLGVQMIFIILVTIVQYHFGR
jgi:hypothetical protein